MLSSFRWTLFAPITCPRMATGRPTTPRLDALAREGTVFDEAYCPTPHTSYSITSMMAGKYMRPLLAPRSRGGLRNLGGRSSSPWAWRHGGVSILAGRILHRRGAVPALRGRPPRIRNTPRWEFADPVLREHQVAASTWRASPRATPLLFYAVHFFEPRAELYVAHADHSFAGVSRPTSMPTMVKSPPPTRASGGSSIS